MTLPRRPLHPAAWWAWAACCAIAAMQTTDPVLLLLLAAAICFVVVTCRRPATWSRSLGAFLRLGAFVVVVRLALQVLFGDRTPGHVLFSLPRVPLPHWAAGVSIGGPVTGESLLDAACMGLRLAVVLLAFGAANSLANPYRLLRSLPAVLYETGVTVTVALAYAPELVARIAELREARRLRGRPTRGFAGLRGMAIPVLEGALDRALALATSMDARGYGRRSDTGGGRSASLATAGALVCLVLGLYDTLSAAAPQALGVGLLCGGGALLCAALALGGRRSRRTRYRPDKFGRAEWGCLLAGAAVAAAYVVASPGTGAPPLGVPPVPLLGLAGVLVATIPALVAPSERTPRRPGGAPSHLVALEHA